MPVESAFDASLSTMHGSMLDFNLFKTAAADAPAAGGGDPAAPQGAGADWPARLHAAMGDDTALLALTRAEAPLDVKLAAVAALASESALKLAEREFRDHDRRVHRLAKQRHGLAVAQREARTRAAGLIEDARALASETLIPLNHLLVLDRAWHALDSSLLEPVQRSEYAELAALMRERVDQPLKLRRWTEQARGALADLMTSCREAAAGSQDRGRLAAAGAAARAVIDIAPEDAAISELADELARGADLAGRLDERLAVLDDVLRVLPEPLPVRLPVHVPAPAAAPAPAPAAAAQVDPIEGAGEGVGEGESAVEQAGDVAGESGSTSAGASASGHADVDAGAVVGAGAGPHVVKPRDVARRWTQLPPLAVASLDELLQQRFALWQQAHEEAFAARRDQRREQARERQRVIKEQRGQALAAVLDLAEAALAAGQLAQTHGHLIEIDRALEGGASAGALRERIDALQAQYAQLKGWQHWGSGRARDELVQQAEALAAATSGQADPSGVKLSIKQRADLIEDMRTRWKELDRLGGATSRSLWQRFEAALKAAYEPVAAQVAAQRTAREQNLKARQQLLDALEAVVLPGSAEGSQGVAGPPQDSLTPSGGGPGAARPRGQSEAVAGPPQDSLTPSGGGPGAAPPRGHPETRDWRALAGALDHFHTGWRRLGPIEHTVPHKARGALVERMGAAVQRLETPLQEARRGVRTEREKLVERARALAAGAGVRGRDLVDQVRELQARWQQQARAMPLARNDEAALWSDFKTAVDAVFSARDAAFKARDAEFKAHGAERAALIERLETLAEDTPAAQLKRTLAEVDALWQRAGPAPRSDAAALDTRYWKARDNARQWLAGSAHRSWNATCDALVAKLVLCGDMESSADPAATQRDVAQRWAALPALPEPLEQALLQRAGLAAAPPPGGAARPMEPTDELLLKLEVAWGLDSPPAFEAARRNLKLQAMKAALETRRPAAAPTTPRQWVSELFRRAGLDAVQRERLGSVLAALRRRGSIGE